MKESMHEYTRKVRAALNLKGLSMADLAQELGLSYNWICWVIAGRFYGAKTRKRIAEVLGYTYDELWEVSKDVE